MGVSSVHTTSIVKVEGLCKSFGQVQALADLSFSIYPGEVVGLIGPNGAGKTTTIKCLAGLIRPSKGSVTFFRDAEGVRFDAGFVYEEDALPKDMTVRRFLIAEAFALGLKEQDVAATMAITSLEKMGKRSISSLSLGNRRRVSLASTLLGERGLIVLDEPTNGLDIDGLQMVRDLIERQMSLGRSVLLSSHTMAEVERVASRILVIQRGRLLFTGTIADLKATASSATLENAYRALLDKGW